jgi:hypothetical protein
MISIEANASKGFSCYHCAFGYNLDLCGRNKWATIITNSPKSGSPCVNEISMGWPLIWLRRCLAQERAFKFLWFFLNHLNRMFWSLDWKMRLNDMITRCFMLTGVRFSRFRFSQTLKSWWKSFVGGEMSAGKSIIHNLSTPFDRVQQHNHCKTSTSCTTDSIILDRTLIQSRESVNCARGVSICSSSEAPLVRRVRKKATIDSACWENRKASRLMLAPIRLRRIPNYCQISSTIAARAKLTRDDCVIMMASGILLREKALAFSKLPR